MRLVCFLYLLCSLMACTKPIKVFLEITPVSDAPIHAIKSAGISGDTLIACGGFRYNRGDTFTVMTAASVGSLKKELLKKQFMISCRLMIH